MGFILEGDIERRTRKENGPVGIIKDKLKVVECLFVLDSLQYMRCQILSRRSTTLNSTILITKIVCSPIPCSYCPLTW
jgi:hypothetical protein